MAKGIFDFGNGNGYIYAVDPDGTTIKKVWRNNAEGARASKVYGVKSFPVALNRRAVGTITISAVTGTGSISSIDIDTVNQISSSIAYTIATTTSDLALLIESAINSFSPGSGPNYIASRHENVIYVYAPVSAGSSVNSLSISVSNTGNLTVTTTELAGGSNNDLVYDESVGFRFFVDADYGATNISGGGVATQDDISNAIEVSKFIINRGMQTASDVQDLTISGGQITAVRNIVETNINVDTEGMAASDNLSSINPVGFVDGDTVILRGTNSSRLVTVVNTGNIQLVNGSWVSGAQYEAIILQFFNGVFYEASRASSNTNPFVSDTYANLVTLKGSNSLVANKTYYITDKNIYVKAITTNRFAEEASYFAYNADWTGVGDYSNVSGFGSALGIWNTGLSGAVAGDVVIWNNRHFRNQLGGAGFSNPDIDFITWSVLGFSTGHGYINEVDEIIYDFDNDYIAERKDRRNNVVSCDRNVAIFFALQDGSRQMNPTDVLKWGNDNFYGNRVVDSYLWNANDEGYSYRNTLENLSAWDDTNTIPSLSSVYGNYLNGSTFSSISISNTSLVHDNTLIGAEMSSTTVDAGEIRDVIASLGAELNLTLASGSKFQYNEVEGNILIALSIATSITYENKKYNNGSSTFTATIDITGLTDIDLVNNSWAGIIALTSTNATEAVTDVSNSSSVISHEFRPESGLAVTFTGTAVASAAADKIILPTANFVADGTNNDWLELQKGVSDALYQINGQNYI